MVGFQKALVDAANQTGSFRLVVWVACLLHFLWDRLLDVFSKMLGHLSTHTMSIQTVSIQHCQETRVFLKEVLLVNKSILVVPLLLVSYRPGSGLTPQALNRCWDLLALFRELVFFQPLSPFIKLLAVDLRSHISDGLPDEFCLIGLMVALSDFLTVEDRGKSGSFL